MSDAESFLAKESKQFQTLYLWLKSAMPSHFFDVVSEEMCLLILHNLIGFRLQEYYSQINFAESSIILSQDEVGADEKIFLHYQKRHIQTFQTFVSTKPLPDEGCFLRVALLSFEKPSKVDPKFTQILDKAKNADLTQCELVRVPNWTPKSRYSLELLLGCSHAPFIDYVPRLFKVLKKRELFLGNLTLQFVSSESEQKTLLLWAELRAKEGVGCWEVTDVEELIQELANVRDFATEDVFEETFVYHGYGDGKLLNFLRATSKFVQQLLYNLDSHMYSQDNVQEAFCYWPELAQDLFRLFSLKFDPFRRNVEKFSPLRQKLLELIDKQDTGKESADIRRKSVLRYGVYFVDSILKTNFFVSRKGALSFRLDASFFKELQEFFPKDAFGTFFICQRDFFGFHIRFQDLARGGLRTIALPTFEQASEEAPLTLLECYQLAMTQQKKNKDIPEGGSKGILLLYPDSIPRVHLYRSQRLFIESLLQLVTGPNANIVDYYDKPEYLYLGPDENMHDEMIEWIAAYAKKINYKPGVAFITSKPKIGINHKRYGVTSLGVNVCMQEVLKYLGIDPTKDSFTVKMAGGPDGDVAGNQILNLQKHFPKTAKLLSLIDVSGVIYDPQGLDLAFLQELFLQSKPIRFYPPEKLSDGGFLLDVRSEKKEGVHIVKLLKQWMRAGQVQSEWLSGSEAREILRSFVHRLEADVFIPAGGRPATLNVNNVHDFLLPNGRPTAKAIIEGANLYITPEARSTLEEAGAIIIKDSSANKGGVICSSFEVLASLTLSEEEFLEHKEELVREILHKVEEYAKDEVRLILQTHKKTGESCCKISEKISARIDLFSEQIRDYLAPLNLGSDPFMSCFFEFVLPLLKKRYSERLIESIPDIHKKAIIASWIASKVVYFRGLDWSPSIVDVLPFVIQDSNITFCPIRSVTR